MRNLLILLLSLHVFWPSTREAMTGKVVEVTDGNTVRVITTDNESYKIHLYGVDCPESQQRYGNQARQLLEKFVLGKKVNVIVEGKDRWGTRQGIVVPASGRDPRIELLREGLAWTSERSPLRDLEAIKKEAQLKGVGLWSDENPIPPWTFRRHQTMLVPKSR